MVCMGEGSCEIAISKSIGLVSGQEHTTGRRETYRPIAAYVRRGSTSSTAPIVL